MSKEETIEQKLKQVANELVIARGLIGDLMIQHEKLHREHAQLMRWVEQQDLGEIANKKEREVNGDA